MKRLFLIVLFCVMMSGMLWVNGGFSQDKENLDAAIQDVIEKLPKEGLKVGDKMPNLEGYEITYPGTWFNPDMTRSGNQANMAKPEEDDKYFVVWNECDGVAAELPFGIFDIETYILYLDNAPTDGMIDEVISVPEGYPYEDAPDCKQ